MHDAMHEKLSGRTKNKCQMTESVEQDMLNAHMGSCYTGNRLHVLKNAVSLYALYNTRSHALKCIPKEKISDVAEHEEDGRSSSLSNSLIHILTVTIATVLVTFSGLAFFGDDSGTSL